VLKKGGTLIRSGLVDISKPLCCYKMDNGVLEFLFGGADRSLLDTYCKVRFPDPGGKWVGAFSHQARV
ncbi:MAG: hypothetical protein V1800_18400, partial [Candidatus Latescibacterota bacterium]